MIIRVAVKNDVENIAKLYICLLYTSLCINLENLYMGNHSLEEFICKDRQGELKEKMKNI